MYTDEKQVGQKAEAMLTAAMRQKIGSLGFAHHKSSNGTHPLGYSFGMARVKLGKGSFEPGRRYFFNRLVLAMPRHGFIHHYGDSGVRSGGTRERRHPKFTKYTFRTHEWHLPKQDFIDEAIDRSGVVPFVVENIARIRGEGVIIYLKNFFVEGNGKRIT